MIPSFFPIVKPLIRHFSEIRSKVLQIEKNTLINSERGIVLQMRQQTIRVHGDP